MWLTASLPSALWEIVQSHPVPGVPSTTCWETWERGPGPGSQGRQTVGASHLLEPPAGLAKVGLQEVHCTSSVLVSSHQRVSHHQRKSHRLPRGTQPLLPSGTATWTCRCKSAQVAQRKSRLEGKGGEESPDKELAFPDSVNGMVCTVLSVGLGTRSINQVEPGGTDF